MEFCASLTLGEGGGGEVIVAVVGAEEGAGLAEEGFDVVSLIAVFAVFVVEPFL